MESNAKCHEIKTLYYGCGYKVMFYMDGFTTVSVWEVKNVIRFWNCEETLIVARLGLRHRNEIGSSLFTGIQNLITYIYGYCILFSCNHTHIRIFHIEII